MQSSRGPASLERPDERSQRPVCLADGEVYVINESELGVKPNSEVADGRNSFERCVMNGVGGQNRFSLQSNGKGFALDGV